MTKKKSSKNSKNNGEDTVVHIKFNRPEAIQSKRDLLFAQRSILELLKHIKRYHLLRKKELVLKEKANKKIKETNKEIEEEIEENQEPIKIEKQKTEKGPNLYRIYRFGKQKLVLPETALKNLKNQLNQIK